MLNFTLLISPFSHDLSPILLYHIRNLGNLIMILSVRFPREILREYNSVDSSLTSIIAIGVRGGI